MNGHDMATRYQRAQADAARFNEDSRIADLRAKLAAVTAERDAERQRAEAAEKRAEALQADVRALRRKAFAVVHARGKLSDLCRVTEDWAPDFDRLMRAIAKLRDALSAECDAGAKGDE